MVRLLPRRHAPLAPMDLGLSPAPQTRRFPDGTSSPCWGNRERLSSRPCSPPWTPSKWVESPRPGVASSTSTLRRRTVWTPPSGQALEGFPGYRSDSGAQMDTELVPVSGLSLSESDAVCLQIRDSHLLETPRAARDQHEIARPIVHWVVLQSPKDRDGFLASVEPLGFFGRGALYERRAGSSLWRQLRAHRAHRHARFMRRPVSCGNLAGEFDGRTTGWETSVERGN
jgi:hypothetical protein